MMALLVMGLVIGAAAGYVFGVNHRESRHALSAVHRASVAVMATSVAARARTAAARTQRQTARMGAR
jgi:hypothetical protein